MVTIERSAFIDNRSFSGGGVQAVGNLTIRDSLFRGNIATDAFGDGGAILVSSSSGSVGAQYLISGSTFENNTAGRDGGAIYLRPSNGAAATLLDNTIISNTAFSRGGGLTIIATGATTAVISESSIHGNQAFESGAGAWISAQDSSAVRIENCTIDHNFARGNGGGVATVSIGSSEIELLQTTVSANWSNGSGGGISISVMGGRTTLSHSTVTQNFAAQLGGGVFATANGPVQITHTIVAYNIGPSSNPDLRVATGTLDLSFSLIGNSNGSGLTPAPVGSPDVNGNLIGGTTTSTRIDPKLGPLADIGGPTMTHALLSGSPAINAGDPAAMAGVGGVPFNDQRGNPFTRVYGGRIDIGAFEVQPTEHLLGDFNRDGTVDSGDYVVWRRYAGMTVPAGTGADGNGDGVVNDADWQLWKSQFGMVYVPPTAATVELQDGEATFPTPDEKAERKALRAAVEQTSLRAHATTLPTPPTSLARPRLAALRSRANTSPARVESRDEALAAWVASSVPAKVSKEVAASNLELLRAAANGASASSKPRALDVVFETLGAAI
jgi:hypothetical protein